MWRRKIKTEVGSLLPPSRRYMPFYSSASVSFGENLLLGLLAQKSNAYFFQDIVKWIFIKVLTFCILSNNEEVLVLTVTVSEAIVKLKSFCPVKEVNMESESSSTCSPPPFSERGPFLNTTNLWGSFSAGRQSLRRCSRSKSKRDETRGASERLKRMCLTCHHHLHMWREGNVSWTMQAACRSCIPPVSSQQGSRLPAPQPHETGPANNLNEPRSRSPNKIPVFWDPQKRYKWSPLDNWSSELCDNDLHDLNH